MPRPCPGAPECHKCGSGTVDVGYTNEVHTGAIAAKSAVAPANGSTKPFIESHEGIPMAAAGSEISASRAAAGLKKQRKI